MYRPMAPHCCPGQAGGRLTLLTPGLYLRPGGLWIFPASYDSTGLHVGNKFEVRKLASRAIPGTPGGRAWPERVNDGSGLGLGGCQCGVGCPDHPEWPSYPSVTCPALQWEQRRLGPGAGGAGSTLLPDPELCSLHPEPSTLLHAPCTLTPNPAPAPCSQGLPAASPLMSFPPVPAARAAESHISTSEGCFLPPTDLAFRLLPSQ